MKILIPTDFSKFAQYAVDYGCKIAEHTQAELILYHCIDDEHTDKIFSKELLGLEDLSNKIDDIRFRQLEQSRTAIEASGQRVKAFISSGNFIAEIKKLVDIEGIDLIIMGAHGLSGFENLLIGSNTLNVLRNIGVNTLLIKSKISDFNFSEVVFASALELRDRQSFTKLLDFIKPFDVTDLHVLTIDISGAFSQPSYAMKAALAYFSELECPIPIHTHFDQDTGVAHGIHQFCQLNAIDLIVMPKHKKSTFTRIFKGSPLEKLIYKSSIPILTIPA